MIIVLDASGAGEIIQRTNNGIDIVNALMGADKVLAPDLYIAEITNIIWKHSRNEKKNADNNIEIIEDCIGYVHEYVNSSELWKDAFLFAKEYDHSVYDMLYAALAKRYDAVLITTDKKLKQICEKISVRIVAKKDSES